MEAKKQQMIPRLRFKTMSIYPLISKASEIRDICLISPSVCVDDGFRNSVCCNCVDRFSSDSLQHSSCTLVQMFFLGGMCRKRYEYFNLI